MTLGSSPPRLAYLCLQATQEGQASYAHVHEIIHGLERRGWSVRLFEPAYASRSSSPGMLGRALEFARVKAAFMRGVRKADAAYVRAHFAAFPAAIWVRLTGKPVVQELNGIYDDAFLAWPRLRWLRPAVVIAQRAQLRWASLVITVTDGLAVWVKGEAGHSRVAVVPNGANVDLFTPTGPARAGLPGRYVAFVGSLAPWQGIEVLLQAVRHPSWPSDVALVMVGSGAAAASVQAAARTDDRVRYMGRLAYAEVPAVVRGALAVLSVQPALTRTTTGGVNPLKVYEALSCGVPAIVSDHPGQADLVREARCGWVVQPGDAAAVAGSVAAAALDPAAAAELGQRGRAAVLAEHSWDARAAATDRLLRQLEHRRRR